MPEFAENRLFLGGNHSCPWLASFAVRMRVSQRLSICSAGDVGDNIMQILHKEKHLKNCVEIVNGVYMGGFQAAKKAVRQEELDAVNSFR